jgi:hypothetical protein
VAYYVLALIAFATEQVPALFRGRLLAFSAPSIHPCLACVLLVAIMVAKVSCIFYAAHHFIPAAEWARDLPIAVVPDNGPVLLHADALAFVNALLAIAISILLWTLAARLDDLPVNGARSLTIAGCAIMGAIAIVSPAFSSADSYANVGYALLGSSAVHPPSHPFAGQYSVINRWWGVPMVPAVYGPLWLIAVSAAAVLGTGLLGKLVALRVLSALCFTGTILAFWRMRLPLAIVAIVALDPDWWIQLVLNVHADVLAVLFVALAGVAVTRGSPVAAIFGTVAAGLVKLPYVIAATSIFTVCSQPFQRFRWALTSVAASAGVAIALGGTAFSGAVTANVGERLELLLRPEHIVTAVLAAAVLCVALASRRTYWSGAWPFAAWAAAIFPWYTAMGIPYAIVLRDRARAFFVLAPIAMLLLDPVFYRGASIAAAFLVAAAVWLIPTLAGATRVLYRAGE